VRRPDAALLVFAFAGNCPAEALNFSRNTKKSGVGPPHSKGLSLLLLARLIPRRKTGWSVEAPDGLFIQQSR
jgi:hypothetical protein